MGHWRRRGERCLRVFLFRRNLSRFDAAVTLAGDVESEGGALESITNRIGDDLVPDDLRPVRQRKL